MLPPKPPGLVLEIVESYSELTIDDVNIVVQYEYRSSPHIGISSLPDRLRYVRSLLPEDTLKIDSWCTGHR